MKRCLTLLIVFAGVVAASPCLALSGSYSPAIPGKAQFSDPDRVMDDTGSKLQAAYVASLRGEGSIPDHASSAVDASQLFNTVGLAPSVASTEVRLDPAQGAERTTAPSAPPAPTKHRG